MRVKRSPHHWYIYIYIYFTFILILYYNLHLGVSSGLFLLVFWIKLCIYLALPGVPHALSICKSILVQHSLAKSANYEPHHYATSRACADYLLMVSNILCNNLFLKTFNLYYALRTDRSILHSPQNTLFCILWFLHFSKGDKYFEVNCRKQFQNLNFC